MSVIAACIEFKLLKGYKTIVTCLLCQGWCRPCGLLQWDRWPGLRGLYVVCTVWPDPQLLDMLSFFSRFEISDQTGDPLSDRDMMQLHYNRITSLQVRTNLVSRAPDCERVIRLFKNRVSEFSTFHAYSSSIIKSFALHLCLLPCVYTFGYRVKHSCDVIN